MLVTVKSEKNPREASGSAPLLRACTRAFQRLECPETTWISDQACIELPGDVTPKQHLGTVFLRFCRFKTQTPKLNVEKLVHLTFEGWIETSDFTISGIWRVP